MELLRYKLEPNKDQNVRPIATVVACAMQTNPMHLAVFGKDNPGSFNIQVNLFELLLELPTSNIVVVKYDNRIVGVMNFYLPGQCQLSKLKTFLKLPRLIRILGTKLPAVLRWKSFWANHDPSNIHFHFGPVAVLPNFQGKGIGSLLISNFCKMCDEQMMNAYLETDKEENLSMYLKFGFQVVRKDVLFDVTCWFMWRPYLINKTVGNK